MQYRNTDNELEWYEGQHEYDTAGRLIRCTQWSYTEGEKLKPNHPSRTQVVEATYNDKGECERLIRTGVREDGQPFRSTDFIDLPAGRMMDLRRQVEAKLPDAIVKVAELAKVKEPVYCLLLVYDHEVGEDYLPPYLALGTDAERQAWGPAADKHWNPAEMKHYQTDGLEYPDDAVKAVCDDLNAARSMQGTGYEDIPVICRIAATLNERDWSKTLNVTDDFAVLAIDLEGEHFKSNLNKCVPADKRKALRKGKWL